MIIALLTPLLAALSEIALEELGLAVAVLLTIIGTVLHWKLPRQRMSFEERVKDNEMTEDQARRWIKFYSICAPLVTFSGIAVLAAVLLGALY